ISRVPRYSAEIAIVNSKVVIIPYPPDPKRAAGKRGPPSPFLLHDPDWDGYIQAGSTQQPCDILFGQTRDIVFYRNCSFRLVERELSHAVNFTDAPNCCHLMFSWRNSILKSHIH